MIVKRMPEMTLAFCLTASKEEGSDKIARFLKQVGKDPEATKKYFFRLIITQRKTRNITYVHYGLVDEGTEGDKEIQIVNLPNSDYLMISIAKREFDDIDNGSDEKIAEAAKTWLKDNKHKFDMRNVFGLIEEDFVDGYDMYNIYFPIK